MSTLNLNDAEQRLIAAACDGLPIDFSSANAAENDPANGAGWGDERTIRAEIIHALATGARDDWPVHPKGIQLIGARIEDQLDLGGAEILRRLALIRCRIEEPIILDDATASSIALTSSHLAGIVANRITVRGSVVLQNVTSTGEVQFSGAKISGQLLCKHARFYNPNKYAFVADSAQIDGGVFLDKGFTAIGEVRLLGAEIGAQLACNGGIFQNPTGDAISADSVTVSGSIFLDDGFAACGKVNAVGARISRDLVCIGGKFDNLILQRAQVSGILAMKSLARPATNEIDLRHARVGQLADDKASWPAKGNLQIDGFEYDAIAPYSPRDAKSRLEWLALVPDKDFSTQPYKRLEKVLRVSGDERGAVEVYIGKRRAIRKNGQMDWRMRAWDWFLDESVGYGYRVWRIPVEAFVIVFAGAFFFWLWFWQMQAPAVASQTVVVSSRSATGRSAVATVVGEAKPPAHPILRRADHALWSFFYSLNVFLPFGGLALQSSHSFRPRYAGDLWFYLFAGWYVLEMLAGWLAAGLIAAAAAGVIQK